MSFRYQAFGLSLLSDRSIPWLLPATGGKPGGEIVIAFEKDQAQKHIHASKSLWYESSPDSDGQVLRVWIIDQDRSFLFLYSDGVSFLIDRSGRNIIASWPEGLTFEDMAIYLIGPILGFVLRLHGVVCLHASAVAINDLAVAILSPAGYGKSTTAAVFATRGFPILSDDIVALSDRGDSFWVQPAYPRLHLWPSTVKELFGQEGVLPRITPENPSWDKRYLDLRRDPYKFQAHPLRLAAIYTGNPAEELDTPTLNTLSAREGFLALTANTYSCRILDKEMRRLEFDVLGRLAAAVPVKCLETLRVWTGPQEISDIILNDARLSLGI